MRQPTVHYRYRYQTNYGPIFLQPEDGGRYQVVFKHEPLGSYANAAQAADDVSGGHTYSPADGIDFADLNIPADLEEWEQLVFGYVMPLRRA